MTSVSPSLQPGIHEDVPAEQYHSDALTEQPSLSASIATILVNQSPAHARAQHPRLNPYLVRDEPDEKYAVGTAAHAMLLEGRDIVEPCEFDSWRSDKAKEARAYAYSQGKVPLLARKYFDVLAMVDAAKKQIEDHAAVPPLLSDGRAEVTMVFDLDGVACRSRIDWLTNDLMVVDDLKSTGRSADPLAFSRNLYQHGYDLKAAFYRRAVNAERKRVGAPAVDVLFRWIAVETQPPYALSVVTPGPDVLALGDDKVDKALAMWRECLATDTWPGYDRRVATAELPPYEEVKWMERSAA